MEATLKSEVAALRKELVADAVEYYTDLSWKRLFGG